MDSRERFLRTLRFEQVEAPWFRGFAFIWPETDAVWREQGYGGPELGWHGEGLHEKMGLDKLLRVDPWYGPVPEFEYRVIEENEKTRVYVNHEGIVMREFKEHADTSMPQFVRFPVETPDEFEKFAAERLALNPEGRFSSEWTDKVVSGGLEGVAGGANVKAVSGAGGQGAGDVHPRLCWADRWGGFFGSLRNMLGLENLSCAFYDNPALVERMMEERADSIIAITEEVMKHTDFDAFWYWEDMAYNHGSLVSPVMFRRFASRHYRRVNDWLRSRGIKHIGLDSDGDIKELLPVWVDSGINMLWPFEVQSGMDVIKVREEYGRNLVIMGGIDKRALVRGEKAIEAEVDRVMPLVEDGGYIPELDHSVPPDISWQSFNKYVEYLKYRIKRG